LVSVDSLRSLRRAYPNYFLDTRLFIKTMNEEIGRPRQRAAKARPKEAAVDATVVPTS